jgi:hypothetical protein
LRIDRSAVHCLSGIPRTLEVTMPTAFEIDVTRRLVVCRCWGVLTSEEIVTHYRALRADPAFDPTFAQLGDLSDVSAFDVDTRALGSEALLETFHSSARRALVAPSDIAFGLARLYGSYAQAASQNLEVFRAKRDAELWLGMRERSDEKSARLEATTAPNGRR